jgi:hypothetical protein
MMRPGSQMDFRTAAKLAQQQSTNFNNFNMLTPLPTYTPQIIDECYEYSSSPEAGMGSFTDKNNNFINSGRSMTPSTPDSFVYHEPLTVSDSFDYMNTQAWADDGSMPIGLGFNGNISGIMPGDMWSTPEPETITPVNICDSPATMNMWTHPSLSSVSPQLPLGMPPHSKAVPSLSLSECSVEEFSSPNHLQQEWTTFQPNPNNAMGSMMSKGPQPIWEDLIMPHQQQFQHQAFVRA